MKTGKYFRNQGRFSRNNGDSAMQPGWKLLKEMPVCLWYLSVEQIRSHHETQLRIFVGLGPVEL